MGFSQSIFHRIIKFSIENSFHENLKMVSLVLINAFK